MVVSSTQPAKRKMKDFLMDAAKEALQKEGWTLVSGSLYGKHSLRRIRKGSITKIVAIRTSQDTWLQCNRNSSDSGWCTYEEADYIAIASVDQKNNPRFAKVFLFEREEVTDRFDKAYEARKRKDYKIVENHRLAISLYDRDSNDPVILAGAGLGLDASKQIGWMPLDPSVPIDDPSEQDETDFSAQELSAHDAPLTIAEAKRRLALSLGVEISNITITVTS